MRLQAAEEHADPAARATLDGASEVLALAARATEGDRAAGEELSRRDLSTREHPVVGAAATSTAPVMARRLSALGGQLRAVATLAPAAGAGGGLRSRRPQPRTNAPLQRLRADADQLRANLSLDSPAGRHALRLAVVVVVAEVASRHLPLQRGYWMVVAAATTLRPEFGATFTRGTERVLGTTLGVALAGAIAAGLPPAGGVVVAIVGILACAGYAVFPASFAAGFGFITALVVFLLDAISPDTLATAEARLLDTLVGGTIGLLAYAVWPTWTKSSARHSLAELLAELDEIVDAANGLAAVLGVEPAAEERTPAPA